MLVATEESSSAPRTSRVFTSAATLVEVCSVIQTPGIGGVLILVSTDCSYIVLFSVNYTMWSLTTGNLFLFVDLGTFLLLPTQLKQSLWWKCLCDTPQLLFISPRPLSVFRHPPNNQGDDTVKWDLGVKNTAVNEAPVFISDSVITFQGWQS